VAENANHLRAACVSPLDWSEALALDLASQYGIVLSHRHWRVIHTLREVYFRQNKHSATRVFMKALQSQHHTSTMLELMQLFGEQPLFTISVIAGLPKPPHCI
jgi:tRNA 2-thiouridine synthesizing protein E